MSEGSPPGMDGRQPGWLASWLVRHRSPLSFRLHLIGIPMTVLAVAMAVGRLLSAGSGPWWAAALLFVVGYGLQYIGHRHEGNDMGEVILVKRWLGKPYISISPRDWPSRGR